MVDTQGAGIVDSINAAVQDLNNPEDWAMDGLALGLDTLGFVASPLSSLFSAGVGWLIEHLAFLEEPLNLLAGDPEQIRHIAAIWGEQVRKDIAAVADDYERAIKTETQTWQGQAAEQYVETAGDIVKQIRALENASTGVANTVNGSGTLVATVRGIIRDLIAEVVGEIGAAAVAALASSWFTLGGSIAAFTGWAVARGAATAGKIASKISKLLNKLANVLSKFRRLSGAVQRLGQLSRRFDGMAKKLGHLAGRHGEAIKKVDTKLESIDGNLLRKIPTDNLPNSVSSKVNAVADTADRVDGAMSKRVREAGPDGAKPFVDSMPAANLGTVGVYEAAKQYSNADENYQQAAEDVANEQAQQGGQQV